MEELIVIVICLAINGFLTAIEMALVSASKPELRVLARRGIGAAQKILTLRENPERALSIIQVGITLMSSVSAGVAGVGAFELFVPYLTANFGLSKHVAEVISLIIAVVPITFFTVVVGELVPKTLALRSPIKIILWGAPWILFIDKVLSPLVTLFEWSTRWILRIFFPKPRKKSSASDLTIEIDALAHHHQQAVMNLAGIESKSVRDIMLSWTDVNFVRVTDTIEEVAQVVFSSGHTRLPVLEDTKVLGILHTKEFITLRETAAKEWKKIIRPIIKIRSVDTVLTALRVLQSARSHMAVVYSPRGELVGVVTLEDISEEVWGEIYDEDDDGIRKVFAERARVKTLQNKKEGS